MKQSIASLLEDDHESLAQLLAELDAELAEPNIAHAFELLDLLWARLAIHLRAENLHLFPAIANAPAAVFTGKGSLPTSEEAHNLLLRLRSDHDFFMKELAQAIKVMREITDKQQAGAKDIQDVRQRLIIIRKRLEVHNRLEEKRAYTWPVMIFDEPTVARLRERVQHELVNLPQRFA
ncbi:MAG: hemerythrin domain-containing protein [Acidobacteriota bacterium]